MVHGLLLAAGAGRRMGTPKALVHDADGTSWLVRSLTVLGEGGCADLTVVLGAEAEQARGLVPPGVEVVVAEDWAEGMGASLRCGLDRLGALPGPTAVLVGLVDLPDVGSDVVRRVLAGGASRSALRRAAYGGVPGHPVLIGRDHWAGVCESAAGDQGARGYLAGRDVELVECGDLASGRDVDHRPPLSGR